MPTSEDAARIASSLPEVVEGERHGNLGWSVGGKGFAWVRPFSKADVKRFGDAAPPAREVVGDVPAGLKHDHDHGHGHDHDHHHPKTRRIR